MELHNIPPLYDENSEILILGSFPSVKSRESGFFYGHAQNRFWKVISTIFNSPEPQNIPEKRKLLLTNHIALWDVIGSCEILGSSDSSIKNAKANDISIVLERAKIRKIILNGKTAEKYYNKYLKGKTEIEALTLPSTSPANAAWTLCSLIEEWGAAIN